MDKQQNAKTLKVKYDAEQDVLYLLFTERAREAIAEEAGDEVFVRFDPDTRQIITVEFLNFWDRLVDTFGPEMKYVGSERPERLILPLGE